MIPDTVQGRFSERGQRTSEGQCRGRWSGTGQGQRSGTSVGQNWEGWSETGEGREPGSQSPWVVQESRPGSSQSQSPWYHFCGVSSSSWGRGGGDDENLKGGKYGKPT